MRTLFLLPFLFILMPAGHNAQGEDSVIAVLGSKWSKSRQTIEKVGPVNNTPAAPVVIPNKNYERNVKAQPPSGAIPRCPLRCQRAA